MSTGSILRNKHGSSLKDRLIGRKEKKATLNVKSKGNDITYLDSSKNLYSSKSTPDLYLNMGYQINAIFDDVIMVHCIEETASPSIFVRFLEYMRALKTWEMHHITLNDNNITSEATTGVFIKPLEYSSIVQIVPMDLKRDPINYCVKICTSSVSILFHAKNAHERDRWLRTIQWKINVYKSRLLLFGSLQPNELLVELQNLVSLTLSSSLSVDGTHQVLLALVSSLLIKKPETINTISHEAIITTLAPLLEKNQPSFEICNFFTKHCRQSPRSLVVVEMFAPIVQRILKHTVDFGKSAWLRTFVVEYIQALNSQNNGKEAVQNFVRSMHGPVRQCPHPRILNNLIAVCLSAIYQCFSDDKPKKKSYKGKWPKQDFYCSSYVASNHDDSLNNHTSMLKANMKNPSQENHLHEKVLKSLDEEKPLNTEVEVAGDLNLKESYSRRDKRLSIVSLDPSQLQSLAFDQLDIVTLFAGVLNEISKLSDWCPGLASFLQPLPFPEGAMSNIQFMRLMYPVIEQFASDDRESVIKCLLYSRDDKEGWLHVYSPGGFACEDDGKLFIQMINALLTPGMQTGKMKKFMTTLARTHLEVIMMLAVRENRVMIEVLRDMLQMGCLLDEQEQLQAISALRCTATGMEVYEDLKQELFSLSIKSGPKSFTLAPNSTDADLNTLLSSGSWGNLECLDLSFTHVTSQSIDVITRLPNLRHLNLWSTNMDDYGLRKLCDYLDLEYLNLCETRVTNEGIECLEAMTNLEYLNLNSTELTPSTFTNLKKKLPKLTHCDITYTDAMTEM